MSAVTRCAALLLLALVLATWPTLGAQSGADATARARELIAQGEFAEAIALLDTVLGERPNDSTALAARAEAYRRSERLDASRADYGRLSELRPDDPDPWFWLGTLDRWAGRLADSYEGYTRAIEREPCHLDALKGRARTEVARRNTNAALDDLRRALGCEAGDEEATGLLAVELSRQGNAAGAAELLAEIFEGAELERRLGALALVGGRLDEAAARFTTATTLDPRSAEAHRGLGTAERRKGNDEAALAAYRRAAELDPADVESHYWVGVLETREADFATGRTAFDAVLAIEPENTAALVGKARLVRFEGFPEEALAILEEALRIDPDNAESRILRAQLLASANRVAEARRELRSVLEDNPLDGDACEALDGLPPRRAWALDGFDDRAVVIEGLEDAGAVVDGQEIVPARVEYINEQIRGEVESDLDDDGRLRLFGDVAWGRQAVVNDSSPTSTVYDFDLVQGQAGLEHRLSDAWRLRWSVGAIRYESRDAGSIPDETDALVLVEARRHDFESTLVARYDRTSFIWRSFASSVDFRIFQRDRLAATYDRLLHDGRSLRAGASASRFDDGNEVGTALFDYQWTRGQRGWIAGFRYDPFPARFLTSTDDLDFIDFTNVSIRGWTPLGPRGLDIEGQALLGYYGKTPELIDTVDMKPKRPEKNNTQVFLVWDLKWAVTGAERLSLGLRYMLQDWDFDTAVYNNNDLRAWTPYMQYLGHIGTRWRYKLRYGHSFIEDERDPSGYQADEIHANVSAVIGRCLRNPGALRFGVELRYGADDLAPPPEFNLEPNEHFTVVRAYLKYPF